MILFYNNSVIADNSLLYSGGPVYYFLHYHTESELIEMLQYHKFLAVPADTTGNVIITANYATIHSSGKHTITSPRWLIEDNKLLAVPTARVARELAPLTFGRPSSLLGALPPNPLFITTTVLYSLVWLF